MTRWEWIESWIGLNVETILDGVSIAIFPMRIKAGFALQFPDFPEYIR